MHVTRGAFSFMINFTKCPVKSKREPSFLKLGSDLVSFFQGGFEVTVVVSLRSRVS